MRRKLAKTAAVLIMTVFLLPGCGPGGDYTDYTPNGSGSEGNAGSERISMEEAIQIALERVPGATEQDISIELDRDDGWYIYEGDILYNRMEYEFEIDADTGTILKWEEERW